MLQPDKLDSNSNGKPLPWPESHVTQGRQMEGTDRRSANLHHLQERSRERTTHPNAMHATS